MYLLVFRDGTCKQTPENLTVLDFVALREGIVSIFRFKNGHQRLVFSDERFLWINVATSEELKACDGRVHA